ncbi:MAG: flagellar biosynthesis anti-sigma factor FlgM [Planctomycetaceae bacterium]
MFYGRQRDIPAKFKNLTRIVGMLAQVQGVREELVAEIRSEIERGEYLSEAKLNAAIHRLLREIMAEEERVS